MENSKNNLLSSEKGKISFRVKANEFDWQNKQDTITLFQLKGKQGSVKIFKKGNRLMARCNFKKQGTKEISANIASLSTVEDHKIDLKWNLENNNLQLYLDSEKIAEK